MRETRADTRQALLLAIGLHVVLFALMFAGLFWTRSSHPVSAAGSPGPLLRKTPSGSMASRSLAGAVAGNTCTSHP